MSGEESRTYNREEFLGEFFPDADDRAEIAAGMDQLRAEQRAYRLADMRRRLGFSQAQVDFGDQRLAFAGPGTEVA